MVLKELKLIKQNFIKVMRIYFLPNLRVFYAFSKKRFLFTKVLTKDFIWKIGELMSQRRNYITYWFYNYLFIIISKSEVYCCNSSSLNEVGD